MSAGAQELQLAPESIEALAHRLAELLGSTVRPEPEGEARVEKISAAEVSRVWGVSRRWVYDHAEALGAIALGSGPRPRLRFDPEVVAERLGAAARGPRPQRPDVRGSAPSGRSRRSDSLPRRRRAIVAADQKVAAGGRPDAPGPAPEEVPRRVPGPGLGGRPRSPLPARRRGGGLS